MVDPQVICNVVADCPLEKTSDGSSLVGQCCSVAESLPSMNKALGWMPDFIKKTNK